jgi:hypothetical protein
MKKIIISIFTTALVSTTLFAQDSDHRENFMFGLKIGGNYSNVYDSKGEEFKADPTIGLAGGVFVSIPLGKFIGVQPEILFSQKGFKATGKLLGSGYDLSRTTSYIDVPIFFAFKPIEFLTILVGPQYSYLIQQDDMFSSGSTSLAQQLAFNNDNIRHNTLCFVGGADVNIKNIVLGLRCGIDAQNNNGDGTSSTPRYKNVWYQATIGFRI